MLDWKPYILQQLAPLNLAPTREAEIAEELAQHLDERCQELIASGQSQELAFRIALDDLKGENLLARRLKPVESELHREPIAVGSSTRTNFLSGSLQDIHYSFRMLRKSPGFTFVAILTIALGIGANTAIFTVINSVLLNNLPVKNPEQLVLLTNPNEQGGATGFNDGVRDGLTYPEFQDIAQHNVVFSGVLAAESSTSVLPVDCERAGKSGEAAPAHLKLVSGSYFSILGVHPILGQAFTEEVDKPRDANAVAVISYGFWQARFAGASDVIGRKLLVLKTAYTVVAVMSPGFHGETVGQNPEIFVPLSMQGEIIPGRDYLSPEANHFSKHEWLQVIGRLKPRVSLAQAKSAIDVEFRQMMQAETAGMSGHDKQLFMRQTLAVTEGSRGASTLRGDFGKPLEILMAVVGLILLIACANIANILLARAVLRQKEIAMRVALGASGARLVRQMLTESILLAAIGGAVGLLFANWAEVALLHMVSAGNGQVPLNLHPNAKILAFTFVVSVLTGILFGLAPAFRTKRVDLNSVLKAAARGFSGTAFRPGGMPIGKVLVVAQVALSVLLLIVAGLFVRSFRNLSTENLGYDRDHMVQFSINALTYGYQRAETIPLYEQILQRLRGIPGVRRVSLSDNGLLGGSDSQDPFTLEGEAKARADEEVRFDWVGPSFFAASGIPLIEGRDIGPQDSGNGQRVGVINETFARRFFRESNPVGQRVVVRDSDGNFDFVIVGVAADSKHDSAREKPFPRFYAPYFNPQGDSWPTYATFIVRTAGNPAGVSSSIRAAVKDAATNLPPVTTETMDQRLADSLTTDRMITELSGAFGVLAAILVCIGLYGIMAYAVSGRTSEIGIRMALGAQRKNVLWMILKESLLLVLVGVVIGVPVVFAAGKWISSLLFGVKAADPLAITLAIVLMFLVGMVACYVPVLRAMRVDPMVALRSE